MKYTKWQQAKIDAGLCPGCGKARTDNRLTCWECRNRIGTNQKRRFAAQRDEIFSHYGGKCVCCGEHEKAFLAIDHLPNTPREGDQRNLTEWICKNNFPPGFQILCHNCNMATRWGKVCPHESQQSIGDLHKPSKPKSTWTQRLKSKLQG